MFLFYNIFLICFWCGIIILVKASSNDPRIIGGFDANKGQFPYQVSLKRNGHHICAGTIVNSRHVVTAGHCVVSGNKELIVSTGNLKVNVGTTSRSGKGGASHSIEKIHLPDSYSKNPVITNDIAVLRIKGTFTFNQFVQPLPLAEEVYVTNDNCTISGWGQTQLSDKKLPENLHYAVVKIIDIYACQNWIGKILARDMLCAGYSLGGIDACQGDSGGPLVCNNTLTGVVSHGYGCALPGRPGIYTDVQVHNKWTSDMIKASSTVFVPLASLLFTIVILNLYNTV